jgi:hypothetical protein
MKNDWLLLTCSLWLGIFVGAERSSLASSSRREEQEKTVQVEGMAKNIGGQWNSKKNPEE